MAQALGERKLSHTSIPLTPHPSYIIKTLKEYATHSLLLEVDLTSKLAQKNPN